MTSYRNCTYARMRHWCQMFDTKLHQFIRHPKHPRPHSYWPLTRLTVLTRGTMKITVWERPEIPVMTCRRNKQWIVGDKGQPQTTKKYIQKDYTKTTSRVECALEVRTDGLSQAAWHCHRWAYTKSRVVGEAAVVLAYKIKSWARRPWSRRTR